MRKLLRRWFCSQGIEITMTRGFEDGTEWIIIRVRQWGFE